MSRIAAHHWVIGYLAKRFMSPRLPAPSPSFATTAELVEPIKISVPTRHGDVPCLVYPAHQTAPLANGGVRPPVYVNLHGGGFVFTHPVHDAFMAQYIAAEVGATVVSVDYSTAPHVQFPVAEEECYDVLAWIASAGNLMNWDGTRIAVGGGSAGAKLTLSALQLVYRAGQPPVRAAVAIVPFADATLPPDSYTSVLPKPVISPGAMRLILGNYFADVKRRSEPLASPLLDPELPKAMPPTVILAGADDTLYPQSERLATMLKTAGVDVTYRVFDNADHNFIALETTPEPIHESLKLISDHLQRYLK